MTVPACARPAIAASSEPFVRRAAAPPLVLCCARSTLAAAALLACMAARSQTESAPPPPAAASAAGTAESAKEERQQPVRLQAVEVTSNKRRQLQSDIAGSVSSVQGSRLEALGARDMEDTLKLTPGVQFDKGGSDNAVLSIRGVATTTEVQPLQQGTTGVYIEDVPFTDGFSQIVIPDVAPFDLSRVEVLKGPQGALYGSSSMGGAIRYLVNRPTRTLEGSMLTSIEGVAHGGVGGSAFGMVNAPLDDVAALRAVVFQRQDAGYIDNVSIGHKDSNTLRQSGGRLLLGARPTGALDVQLMAMTQRTKVDDTNAVTPDPDRLTTNSQIAGKNKSEWSLLNAQVNYDVGDLRITSNTGYQRKVRHDVGDDTVRFGPTSAIADPSLPPFPFVKFMNDGSVTSTSQELRIAPVSPGPVSYVAGVFWQKAEIENDAFWDIPGGAQFLGPSGPTLLPNDRLAAELIAARTREAAVFFDGEWTLSPAWTVGVGARRYKTWFTYHDRLEAPLISDPLDLTPSTADSGLSPKISVRYKWSPQVQWYALRSQGYRFGGVNDAPFSIYKSDKLINYETGLRVNPTNALAATLAVYRLDWKDAQVTVKAPPEYPGYLITQNVGKAKVDGAELTIGWSPSASWQWDVAVAYADARTVVPLDSDIVYPAGSRLPGTAKWQSTVQGTYRFALGDDSARISLLLASLGRRYADLANQIPLPGYTTADARFTVSRSDWEFAAYVNNLTDARGRVSATETGNTYLVRPRTLGVSARRDF